MMAAATCYTCRTSCLQYRHYQSLLELLQLSPSKESKELGELAMFVAQVRTHTHTHTHTVSTTRGEIARELSRSIDWATVHCSIGDLCGVPSGFTPRSLDCFFWQQARPGDMYTVCVPK